jgi:hypothetical protein
VVGGGIDEPTEDELKLLGAFKGCQPNDTIYLDDQKALFANVQDLEKAQAGLARRGWVKLIPLPNVPGRTDRLCSVVLTLDGYRKLEEI